jgi:transcriptional regulator with XRE-family HTH domain
MEEEQFIEKFGADEKIGDYLRRAREARKLDLAYMAKSIRLSTEVVQAIEESRWGYFQVEAYLRCYLVSICEKLQIDKTDVLKKLSLEINSTFKKTEPVSIIRADVTKSKEQKPQGKFPTVEIIVVLAVIAILFFVAKSMNSEMEEEDEPEDTTEFQQQESSEAEAELVPEELPATASGSENPNATDTLRFECVPSATDNTCGIKLNGVDSKMIFFKRPETRYINRGTDTAYLTITVPERTRILFNGEKLDYGKFNTLQFYKGELVKKFNREVR